MCMYTGKHAMSDDSIDVVVDSVESNQYRSPKNPKFKLKAQIWKNPNFEFIYYIRTMKPPKILNTNF